MMNIKSRFNIGKQLQSNINLEYSLKSANDLMRVTPFRQYKGKGKAKMHRDGILATAKRLTNKPGK